MSDLKRLFGIGFAVSAYLVWWLMIRLCLWHSPVTLAQRLHHTFEQLGATFVKLGQGLSLHHDLLPDEYIRDCRVCRIRLHPFLARLCGEKWKMRWGNPSMKCSPNRSSNRVALALVTLGLYIAASLLMQHSIGPRLGGMPVLGMAGYTLVLWFTWRLARGISRSGRL